MVLTTVALFAQPANDACADAIAIMIDEVVDFTTVDATDDGVNHTDCLGANDSIPADIWYTFTAAADGVLRWSNCGTANYDSRMAVYAVSDPCGATDDNLVACNDDGPAECAADFFTSEMNFLVVSGQDYVLRLGGFAGDDGIIATGTGTVVLSEVDGPVNDFCANSTEIFLGTDQAFSTLDALTDGPDHPDNPCFGFGSLTAGADIWYTYTPDFTGFVEWSTCNTASFDTRLAVYNPGSACPPVDEDLYACNDDGAACAAFSSSVTFGVVAGETYLLRLGGFGADSGDGTFNLTMVTPPDPPVNDSCTNAIAVPLLTLEVADDFEEQNLGTTVSGTFVSENYQFPVCLANQNGGEFADVWYTFESLGNTEIDIRLYPAGDAPSFFLDIFASCGARVDTSVIMGSCVFVNEDNPFGETTVSGFPAGENVTYYVRVSSRLTTDVPGPFAFQLVADVVSDVNDETFATGLELFPNPVNDQATVRFSLEESASLEAIVVDMLGRRVNRLDLGLLPGGNQQFTLDTRSLPAGVYSLQLSNGQARQNLKFVVN